MTPWRYCLCGAALLCVAVPASAQSPESQKAAGLLETIRLADQPYTDASFGFALRPFSDGDLTRQKRFTDAGETELVQFFHYRLNWAMTVNLARIERPLSPDEMLARIEKRLADQHPGFQAVRRDKLTITGHDAVRFAGTAKVKDAEWFVQEAVVAVRPTEWFVILFNTPVDHRAKSEPLFDEILGSFQMLRSEMTQELLQQSLVRGTELLRKVAADGTIAKNLIEEHYLRTLVDGRDVGYLWLRELRTTQNRRAGVGLHQEGWIFDAGGAVRIQVTQMFLSDDMAYERWDMRTRILIPAAGNVPMRVEQTIEQGVREQDRLLIAYTKPGNVEKLEDRTIAVSPSFAPVAFFTLLPRLLDAKNPQTYAFAAYNSERHGLVVRSIRVVGSQDILVDGRSARVTRIEDSEGLIPPVSEIYVDAQGRLARVVAGNVEMIGTPKSKIVAMYSEKMKSVQQSMQQLMQMSQPKAKPPAGRGEDAKRGSRRQQ